MVDPTLQGDGKQHVPDKGFANRVLHRPLVVLILAIGFCLLGAFLLAAGQHRQVRSWSWLGGCPNQASLNWS